MSNHIQVVCDDTEQIILSFDGSTRSIEAVHTGQERWTVTLYECFEGEPTEVVVRHQDAMSRTALVADMAGQLTDWERRTEEWEAREPQHW